jgi:hypothetical protein
MPRLIFEAPLSQRRASMEKKYWDPFVKQVHMCCVERKEGEGVYC